VFFVQQLRNKKLYIRAVYILK